MPLKKFTFRPGIVRDATNYANEGGWYDCNNVRFRAGFPESIGGYVRESITSYLGQCRSIHPWVALDYGAYAGIGTNIKFYIYYGALFYDVTPVRRTVTLGADPMITVLAGSGLITITDTAHGAAAGDYVTISGATGPIDGIAAADINKEHQIYYVGSVDGYQILTAGTATAGSVSGGGSSVVAAYQIPIGLADYVSGDGWGSGPYGYPAYGTSSSIGATVYQLRTWTQGNFGENLLAAPNGGGIYYWSKSAGLAARMVNITSLAGSSDAPTVVSIMGISYLDRHVVAMGANPIGSASQDLLMVRWSSQESLIDWTPTSTNTAGYYRLSVGSRIVASLFSKNETLIWTDSALYSMRFTGPPYTFSFELISSATTIASVHAPVSANNTIYWMGSGGFFAYTGRVDQIPCPISDYVFSGMNNSQTEKVIGGRITKHNEVIWFYPSEDSVEIDRFVLYNYVDNVWSYGTMSRTAWAESVDSGKIYGAAGGIVYLQESGVDADGAALLSHIESSDFDLDDGEKFAFVDAIIPDVEFRGTGSEDEQMVDIVISHRGVPGAAQTLAPFTVYANGGGAKKNVRVRGRQMAVKIENTTAGTAWRVGSVRLRLQEDGRR